MSAVHAPGAGESEGLGVEIACEGEGQEEGRLGEQRQEREGGGKGRDLRVENCCAILVVCTVLSLRNKRDASVSGESHEAKLLSFRVNEDTSDNLLSPRSWRATARRSRHCCRAKPRAESLPPHHPRHGSPPTSAAAAAPPPVTRRRHGRTQDVPQRQGRPVLLGQGQIHLCRPDSGLRSVPHASPSPPSSSPPPPATATHADLREIHGTGS